MSDIRHRKNRHNTTLANHIWNLNDEGKDFDLEWNLNHLTHHPKMQGLPKGKEEHFVQQDRKLFK